MPGIANIYVDGSFIATTHIPSASPQEVFDCPLGCDIDSFIHFFYDSLDFSDWIRRFELRITLERRNQPSLDSILKARINRSRSGSAFSTLNLSPFKNSKS